MNIMDIDGYKAAIAYDPDIDLFRGEFIELNGGADFSRGRGYPAKGRRNLAARVPDIAGERHRTATFQGNSMRISTPSWRWKQPNGKSLNAVVADKLAGMKNVVRHLYYV